MKYVLLALFLVGCGKTGYQPIEGRPGHYRLHYCADEEACFKRAEKLCPNGYRVTRYGTHPEAIACQ